MNGLSVSTSGAIEPAPDASAVRVPATRACVFALAVIAFAGAAPTAHAGVTAGTLITNTAHARYELDGVVHEIDTNAVVTRVDEIVAIEIDAAEGAANTTAGETVLAFTVRNSGNGCETVVLTASTGDASAADNTTIAIDANGDGVLQPEIDIPYVADAGPHLCAGERVRVFVVVRADPRASNEGEVTLTARGASGGARGAIVPRAGDNGSDIVSGGDALLRRAFAFAAPEPLRMSLLISQTVLSDPSSTRVVAGDVIAYTLRVTATGSGLVADAVLTDALPAGITYLAGSLLIDGQPISDGRDADIGDVADGMVTIRVPPTAAPFDYRVTFNASVHAPQSLNGVSP